ncbi:MAG: PspC domain-containing protein [Bacteroidetes bacterium]|uniref:PspC domain-containing protein n=1 Tax=Phnomibacter sp. TaxID=2836217 RepID=UPI002FDDF9AE|nr:PspC domain-containing protein [Bacteroidota bacterium]
MKKVININFQGRVIPIEETAYEMLQNYISSLRNYFANEEGREEIINDIENRIGELFGEALKKGAACITDDELNKIMSNIGRPEDFAANDEEAGSASGASAADYTHTQQQYSYQQQYQQTTEPKRLYRDEQDKILAGVASGIAHYLGIDPAVVRLIFAFLLIVGGTGILLYIILWIVLPSKSLVNHVRKRLFRDPDDKVISGVCGGLGKYFDINPAIPRVIFAAPFIFGIITSIGRNFFDDGPIIVGGFGGSTFILVYVILWIVLPEALTASEKLEMRGEKVDLNSIRNTVMSDLQGFKGRAQKMGEDVKVSAQKMGAEMKETFQERGQAFNAEVKKSSGGIGNAIAILVKAFVYFVLGCVAFGLFVALIALTGAGVGVMPLHDFFLQGTSQNLYALGTLVLFVGVPIISILVWFIRRLMKVRTHNKFIGYAFTAMWFVGLFCLIALLGSVRRSFSTQVGKREEIKIEQPANGKLEVAIADEQITYYDGWFEMDGLVSIDGDSMHLNTAKVNVVKSKDSLYHVHMIKMSRGREREQAQRLAEKINFPVVQKENVLYLPATFTIARNDKWRNQKVLIVIEVPEGKKIRMSNEVEDYDYFSIDFGRSRRGFRIDVDREWEEGLYWEDEIDMQMTNDRLEWDGREPARVRSNDRRRNSDRDRETIITDTNNVKEPAAPAVPNKKATPDSVYRYKQATQKTIETSTDDATVSAGGFKPMSPLASVLKLF